MSLSRSVRRVAIVLVPLLVAATWAGVWQNAPRVEHFWWLDMTFGEENLTPMPPPMETALPGLGPRGFTWARVTDQAGGLFWPLLAGAALVLVGLVGSLISLVRRRVRVSRRWLRVPLRAGLLALLLGIAAASLLAASEFVVLRELGPLEFWVGSDRASTPWGSAGVAAGAVLVGFAGILITAVLTVVGRLLGDRS